MPTRDKAQHIIHGENYRTGVHMHTPEKSERRMAIAAFAGWMLMLLVNGMANLLPLNGVTTAQVSADYPSLFTPAGFTFAIWAPIYGLLGMVAVLRLVRVLRGRMTPGVPCGEIDRWFLVSSLANLMWVFAWHFDLIWLSMLLIVGMLMALTLLHRTLDRMGVTGMTRGRMRRIAAEQEAPPAALDKGTRWVLQVAFSMYWAWICVATIANAAVLLVSLGFNGFGIPDTVWTIGALGLALLLGTCQVVLRDNRTFGLVMLWAFFGILRVHASVLGWQGRYREVMIAANICLILMVAALLYSVLRKGPEAAEEERGVARR